MTVHCSHPAISGSLAAGGIGGLLHTTAKIQQHVADQHTPHYAGKGLGFDSLNIDFSQVPLTPMAHAVAGGGTTMSIVAIAGMSVVALVLVSMMVRAVLVACLR
jgi:hypothetical protein